MTTLTPDIADVIARNREKLRYSGPLRVTREDCAALLAAAEELERVKRWAKGRCVTCDYQGTCVCRVCKRSGMQDFNPNGHPDQWTPPWRATA